jgi:hypothetical protein
MLFAETRQREEKEVERIFMLFFLLIVSVPMCD